MSEVRLVCQTSGIQFLERGDSALYIKRSLARDFIECCRENGWIILGVEGFKITENETHPIDGLVADFSGIESSLKSYDEALLFLALDEALDASHFDFVIDASKTGSSTR